MILDSVLANRQIFVFLRLFLVFFFATADVSESNKSLRQIAQQCLIIFTREKKKKKTFLSHRSIVHWLFLQSLVEHQNHVIFSCWPLMIVMMIDDYGTNEMTN